MEETAIPYELPDVDNHSFFFIDRRIPPDIEAKLHHHDAWELYAIVHGHGNRQAGDTLQPFAPGDVVLIPPAMHHRWEYAPDSTDEQGCIRYLMVAFSHQFVEQSMNDFPELRNRLIGVEFPTQARKLGSENSRTIRQALEEMNGMDELNRLCSMLRLLPGLFTTTDYTFAGNPIRIEKDVKRIRQIYTYVMTYYTRTISLDDIAAEVGMNRSAFCTYFKRIKGITFSQFVTRYRLTTACTLLHTSDKQISEICYMVGFNDVPHFVRVFTKNLGMSPRKYRAQAKKRPVSSRDTGS